jgi:hypothetical protein
MPIARSEPDGRPHRLRGPTETRDERRPRSEVNASDRIAADPRRDPTHDARDTTLRDAHLEREVLNLFGSWLRRTHEASSAHTEAAIDRASFESFPASDPVAPAAASNDRSPALEEIECTLSAGEPVLRCAQTEGELSDGRRGGQERRGDACHLPEGFDRRHAQRRAAEGTGRAAPTITG